MRDERDSNLLDRLRIPSFVRPSLDTKRRYSVLKDNISSGGVMMDVGCGSGELGAYTAQELGAKLIQVDTQDQRDGLYNYGELLSSPASKPPTFPEKYHGVVDTALVVDVLNHIGYPNQVDQPTSQIDFLRALLPTLKVDGKIVIAQTKEVGVQNLITNKLQDLVAVDSQLQNKVIFLGLPTREKKTSVKRSLSQLNQTRLFFEDDEVVKEAEMIVLENVANPKAVLELEKHSACLYSTEGEEPGTMPRWRRLIALDAIVRTLELSNVDQSIIKRVFFLDYRDKKQEEANDGKCAQTILAKDGKIYITIHYSQLKETAGTSEWTAIFSAHEAKHVAQIHQGSLTHDIFPDVHKAYKLVNEKFDNDTNLTVTMPDTLEGYRDYYGRSGTAHPLEVEAVQTSLDVFNTMTYLSLEEN